MILSLGTEAVSGFFCLIFPKLSEYLFVNWGRGRLREFQSLESFYVEFSILNKLIVFDKQEH